VAALRSNASTGEYFGRFARSAQRHEANCCWRVGPQRAGHFGLRANVDRTEVRNASASKGKGKHFWVGDADPSY
jgi:hypothetical protein